MGLLPVRGQTGKICLPWFHVDHPAITEPESLYLQGSRVVLHQIEKVFDIIFVVE